MAKIAIVYYSGSGNTEKMAKLIAEGATKAGVEAQLLKAGGLDAAKVLDADGLALGSPDYFSYMAGELKSFFDRAFSQRAKLSGKPYVSFGSHGGGGQVLKSIDSVAGGIGLKQVCPGVLSKGAPDAAASDACRKLGEALAAAVKKK